MKQTTASKQPENTFWLFFFPLSAACMQGQGRAAGEYFGRGWSCCTRRTNNCVKVLVRSARPHQKEQTQHCPHPREFFGFPGITSFQSSSPGTLCLPLSWWKTIPLLDASFCGSFPDLFLEQYLYLTHSTPQYSSDDCSQYFIFFLMVFVVETRCSDREDYQIAGRLSITLQVPGRLLSGKSFLQAGTEPGNLVYLIHTRLFLMCSAKILVSRL